MKEVWVGSGGDIKGEVVEMCRIMAAYCPESAVVLIQARVGVRGAGCHLYKI